MMFGIHDLVWVNNKQYIINSYNILYYIDDRIGLKYIHKL